MTREFEAYKCAVRNFWTHPAASETSNWQAFYDWYNTGGRQLFLDSFSKETGLRTHLSTDQNALVSAALFKSFADLESKSAGTAFYRAHAQWFLQEMDAIIAAVPRTSPSPFSETSYGNALRFARKVLIDSVLLFEHWGTYHAKVPNVFGIGKVESEHIMHFFQGARQTVYGHGTFNLSFSDNHSDLAIATVRQALEIRLRRAFGVIGKTSRLDGSFRPIPLSDLLEAIETHKGHVSFPVRFENIKRINAWANIYLHDGFSSTFRARLPFGHCAHPSASSVGIHYKSSALSASKAPF